MADPIPTERSRSKAPAVAGLWSAYLPGAGAMYNGLYTKCILYILIFAGLITMQNRGGQPFFGLMLAAFYFFQIIDSVNNSKAINKTAAGGSTSPGEPVPAPLSPSPSGSIFWGVLMMALGGIFLLGNFDVIDFDRLWDFWPVIVIVIGVKMIFDYFSRKNA